MQMGGSGVFFDPMHPENAEQMAMINGDGNPKVEIHVQLYTRAYDTFNLAKDFMRYERYGFPSQGFFDNVAPNTKNYHQIYVLIYVIWLTLCFVFNHIFLLFISLGLFALSIKFGEKFPNIPAINFDRSRTRNIILAIYLIIVLFTHSEHFFHAIWFPLLFYIVHSIFYGPDKNQVLPM